MDDKFEDAEKLYRAVTPTGMYIKADGTISSAAFKTSEGCSVDRGNYRQDAEAAAFMKQSLSGSIYMFFVKDCRDRDIRIRYEPIDTNPYHSGLYKNEALEKLTQGQCRHLASIAKCVMA